MTIVKSTNEGRIKENQAATRIRLTPEEVETLKRVDKKERLFLWKRHWQERDTVEAIFDEVEDKAFAL